MLLDRSRQPSSVSFLTGWNVRQKPYRSKARKKKSIIDPSSRLLYIVNNVIGFLQVDRFFM